MGPVTRYLIQKPADGPLSHSVVHSLVRTELYVRRRLQQEKQRASRQMEYIRGTWHMCAPGQFAAPQAYVRGGLGKT